MPVDITRRPMPCPETCFPDDSDGNPEITGAEPFRQSLVPDRPVSASYVLLPVLRCLCSRDYLIPAGSGGTSRKYSSVSFSIAERE